MTGKTKALGRGLDALFGDMQTPVLTTRRQPASENPSEKQPPAAAPENAVLYLDIDEIKPNGMQPRQTFDAETIEELAASIETYGVIQPILVKKTDLGYELIAGERRWRAARKAGLREIPSIVKNVTSEENALIALIENMQREDLNPLEEAGAYRTIIGKYRMTQEALSRAVGKSRSHIANTLRLLKFPEEILEYLRTGALSQGHANALGAVRDEATQQKIAERIVRNGLSVREAERICADAAHGREKQKRRPRRDAAKSEDIRRVEEELTSLVGTKVVIKGTRATGSVELQYFEEDGLDEIVEFLRAAGKSRG
ncbi:MAG: ParB/RepB/Spo0J family partition protein [Clostridiales Family XIII bacterium]|jgi:ParB family chromosome partitioning protein|nr:ParB/RepB/Spo0J family partition protein [Clostridiales Family XIII bacterium]